MIISSSASRKRMILLHLLGCIGFVILPFLFFPHPESLINSFSNEPTIRDFIGQLILIGFFYLNYYVLIPKYYYASKYAVFTVLVIACFLVTLLLPSLLTGRFDHSLSHQSFPVQDSGFHSRLRSQRPQGEPPNNSSHYPPNEPPDNDDHLSFLIEVSHTVFLFLIVLFFSLMLRINARWKEAQKEKSDAELSYLKAQINPHFLFNTLNSIYSLTIQKSDAASDAVVKLAGLMRYILHDADKDFVSLQKEVEYIRDYVELQRLRFGNQVPVDFAVNGDADDKKIAPLILINFIENAFKHGINAEENSHIEIHIDVTDDSLIMKVRNNKVQVQMSESSGTGLQNVRSRLQLLYPDKHQLTIENEDTYYSVILHLWLA